MAKTQLPGLGRSLDYIPKKKDSDFIGKPFPTALDIDETDASSFELPMTTLREFTMLQLMNVVTDKKDWNTKLQNPEIAKKWKDEALSSGLDVTPKMVDWCLDELRYKASLIPPDAPMPPIFVYNGDVIKSDNAVSDQLKVALQENVKIFESKIPDRSRDWHPGSNQKVWDLVHPSLFPLVYSRTRVLSDGGITTLEDCIERCGQGDVLRPYPHVSELIPAGFSCDFQWLPCEVDISRDQSKITTYINNLHPQKEKPLYEIISQLITASIPLWELTLAPLVHDTDFSRTMRIAYTECAYDPDPENGPETDGPQRKADEQEDDFWERREQWYADTRTVIRPEPGVFEPQENPPKLDLREKYGKRGLQVIVKLANIELTPDKPEYEGGTWHVEGQLNEHIVATSLYYYSNDNITPSSLSFKQHCDGEELDIDYQQEHHDWLEVVYGCQQNGPCVQYVGSVDTCEGRLLTFPNVLLHRVEPFKLMDPTKPGHRKILALFLVDPNIRVISTAHVPCQRKDWWIEAALDSKENTDVNSPHVSSQRPDQARPLDRLPHELRDLIFNNVDDFPMSMEDAKTFRVKLMKERQNFTINHGQLLESFTFSLCEH